MQPELAAGEGIDAGGWLIEKKNVRLVHQRAGQRQALLIAERQLIGGVAGNGLQAKRFAHPRHLLPLRAAAQSIDAGEEAQVLLHGQVAVEGELLRHIAEALTRLAGADFKIHIQHQRLTGGRHQQAAHHLKGGGFARAVRAEQAKDLAALDGKIDLVGGGEIAKLFGERSRFNHRLFAVTLHRMQDLAKRRLGGTRAAQQVDKGILKARSGLLNL